MFRFPILLYYNYHHIMQNDLLIGRAVAKISIKSVRRRELFHFVRLLFAYFHEFAEYCIRFYKFLNTSPIL